jgi:polyisoprenoid-binding protein YceI
MTYRSTSLRPIGDGYPVSGELCLHGVTRATTQINRRDFGIDVSLPLDGGGVVVGDKVKVSLEIEAVLQSSQP